MAAKFDCISKMALTFQYPIHEVAEDLWKTNLQNAQKLVDLMQWNLVAKFDKLAWLSFLSSYRDQQTKQGEM